VLPATPPEQSARNDLATMAIAKVIIGLAKEGERGAGRLCALALKRISK
jgi:hypothetical protein